jgi:hypothetical protein
MPLIVRGQMYGCLDLTEMDTLTRSDNAYPSSAMSGCIEGQPTRDRGAKTT